MKTIKIFFITTILFALSAHSQITKGNWIVGGSANFNNSNSVNSDGDITGSGNGVQIYPNIGYFVYDKFAVGLSAGFSYGKPSGSPSNTSYGLSPFVRYYFLKPDKLINVLAEASYGYNISKIQGNSNTFDSRGYRVKAGPVLYFNSSVGLELTFNYNSSNSDGNTYNYFQAGFGFQIHLEK
jgi:hypothetical protein